jgi:hypothetical protein
MAPQGSPEPPWASQSQKVELTPSTSTTGGGLGLDHPGTGPYERPPGGVLGWVLLNVHSVEWRVNEFSVRDQ